MNGMLPAVLAKLPTNTPVERPHLPGAEIAPVINSRNPRGVSLGCSFGEYATFESFSSLFRESFFTSEACYIGNRPLRCPVIDQEILLGRG